jgi:hypothetical protein
MAFCRIVNVDGFVKSRKTPHLSLRALRQAQDKLREAISYLAGYSGDCHGASRLAMTPWDFLQSVNVKQWNKTFKWK